LKTFFILFGYLFAGFLALQLVTIDIPKAPDSSPADKIETPKEISTLFKRACNDCHSNHTAWPWYSDIAPISFEVRGHVKDGRAWLNFDIWNRYTKEQKNERLEGIVKTIDTKMPIPMYIMAHPEAKLTHNERESIKKWAKESIKE